MTFVGGYTYRFMQASGKSADYVFAGGSGDDTLWRAADASLVNGADVFKGVVEVREVDRPERAANEVR